MDSFFFIDIIIIFFTTIPPTEESDEIDDYKIIAKSYLTGWFTVDLLAILPLDFILAAVTEGDFTMCESNEIIAKKIISEGTSSSETTQANILLRAPKLQKIMKSIRLFRMVKLIKLVKNS